MNQMDRLWSIGMRWTPQRPLPVSAHFCVSVNKVDVFILFLSSFSHPLTGRLVVTTVYLSDIVCCNFPAKAVFARGIAAVQEKYICVGEWLHLSAVAI